MLLRIARKEFTEMVRDGRLRWAGAAIGGLLVVALAAGVTAHRATRAERNAAQSQMQAWWYKQPPKNPHSAAHYGMWAFKPSPALTFVDRGVDPYTGTAAWLEAHRQNDFRFRPAMDATAAQRFGDWTAASVLQQLVPLLIIILAFGAFAGEREQGTLRQVLSLGVRPVTLGAGKALGIAAALGVVLVPATLLGVLAMTGIGAGSDLTRVLVLLACYLLFYIAWLGLTLTISAWAPTGRVALAGALGVWMLVSVLAPRVMTDVVRTVHPTPSAAAFAAAMKRDLAGGMDGHGGAAERDKLFKAAVLQKYGVDSLSQLPVSFAGLSLEEGERLGNVVFDTHYSALWKTFADQERVREFAAIVSPVLAIRSLSMALAGTDVAQHVHFQTAAEQYRRRLMTAMNGEIITKAEGTDFEYRADSTTWANVPPFTYVAPGVGWVVERHIPAILLLGVWAASLMLLTAWSVRRMAP